MNAALRSLIARYQPSTSRDWENALREIIQELALLGLWRSKFYEHAAFYGGTALRIFHGLPRFSEDFDFSLLKPSPDFDFKPHLAAVRAELTAFGFSFEVAPRAKRMETAIESAFIKGETRVNLLQIGAPESLRSYFPSSQKLSVRLEIDTDPPTGAEDEVRTQLVPIPYQVRLYTLPCLFAGKLHAILCRNWKSRVKGRDFYDLVWYVGRDTPVALSHLRQRMEQTGHWEPSVPFDLAQLKRLLRKRFEDVDFAQAKGDVRPFIRDADEIALWSREFFDGLADRLLEK
jgi:hypothetical protein